MRKWLFIYGIISITLFSCSNGSEQAGEKQIEEEIEAESKEELNIDLSIDTANVENIDTVPVAP